MPQSNSDAFKAPTPNARWNTPVRLLHWLIAASMAGAVFLTAPGGIGHAALGWVALGALLIRLFGSGKTAPDPTLWLVTASVVILDMSGLFTPDGSIHMGATLAVLVLASFYCATVLFESLQWLTARRVVETTSPAAG